MVFGRESRVALAVLAAALLVLAGVFASPARAQQLEDEEVLDVLVDVEVGECDEGQCDEGERPVTFTPVLSLNADLEQELLDADVAPADIDRALDAAAEVAEFGEIVVEDSEGNEVARVDPGETVCLEPGSYTASASVDNAEVTAQAAIDELEALPTDVDLSQLVENVDVVAEDFVVDECDEVPDDRDQTVCQIVVTEVNDLQNPDVDVNNSPDEETQALQEPEEGEVSDEQVVDIAQELNVSERIVRRCIQNNFGDDDNNDGNNDDGNNNDGTDTDDDTTARDDLKDDVIVDTIPDKTLPDTSGVPLPALAALALAFVVAGALVLRGVIRRYY